MGTTLRTGDRIDGRYRVLDLLADGGMGTVFLAEHVLIKRRVALKVLHDELAHDVLTVHHFLTEGTAAGTLGHPNIVESTDMGHTDDGVPFIVYELLEGALLSAELRRAGVLPIRRAVRIARQIAAALVAAHAKSIIHLDLKCDNVFLVEHEGITDHVKVIDFGIACQLGRDKHSTITGTVDYMPPEQITAPATLDQRADIYALGVVLYEMVAGHCPFEDADPLALMRQVVTQDPPPLGPDVPPALALLIDEMLAKHPDDRPPSMKHVLAALDEIEDDLELPMTFQLPVIATPPPAQPWPFGMIALRLAVGFAAYLIA
ncbi:MAG: serine/threonine-protein kinase [Kofleriaceae bacterium]